MHAIMMQCEAMQDWLFTRITHSIGLRWDVSTAPHLGMAKSSRQLWYVASLLLFDVAAHDRIIIRDILARCSHTSDAGTVLIVFMGRWPQEALKQEEEYQLHLATQASLAPPLHSHAEALAFKYWSTGRCAPYSMSESGRREAQGGHRVLSGAGCTLGSANKDSEHNHMGYVMLDVVGVKAARGRIRGVEG